MSHELKNLHECNSLILSYKSKDNQINKVRRLCNSVTNLGSFE